MNLQSLIKTVLYKAGYSIKRVRATSRTERKAGGFRSADVLKLLHRENPYANFDFAARPLDLQGWGGDSPAFGQLIRELKPRLIVEVGTWKGASALKMAGAARELSLPVQIVCVDTWLGALEFWTDHNDPERYFGLQLRNGYPSVYYQFLANVCHCGFQDWIVPFPQTATTAALWFRQQGLSADLVYLDASHEEEDVYEDVCSYWGVLQPNGVLFGDDYAWDGVRLAVDRFARETKKQLTFVADKWVLRR